MRTLNELPELIWVNGEAKETIVKEATKWYMKYKNCADPFEVGKAAFIKHFFDIEDE